MKRTLLIVLQFVLIVSCSNTPSVSVQPSEEFFDAAGTQLTAKMDILFVIDNSVSMREEQENMMANFSSFIGNFVGKGYDYRIATVATDAWITKGFFDYRAAPPISVDSKKFLLMDDHVSSAEYNPNNFTRVDNDGSSIISYDPLNYAGFPDLQFYRNKSGSDYYRLICSRDNYVTSRFSQGDYTKALMGSSFNTNNGESGLSGGDADPRYLSGYPIVSSEDETIDTNFYGFENEDFLDLRNRDNSFYTLPSINLTPPVGKNHILDIFRNNIMQGLDGCFGESGLEAARTVLDNPFNHAIDIDGAGPLEAQQFPRPDAHLAVIIVSDMRDEMAGVRDAGNMRQIVPNYSLGSTSGDGTFSQERLDTYKDYFESISSDAFGYSVHVIVPTGDEVVTLSSRYEELDPPIFISDGSDCSGDDPFNNQECYVANDTKNTPTLADDVLVTNDEIQPDIECFTEWRQNVPDGMGGNVSVPREAKMYTQMAEQTGGQKASICGDFAEKLENIARVIIERTTEVKLDKTPRDVDLLFVSINYASDSPDLGLVDIPQDPVNGWTYNEVGNTVVFNGDSIPDQNAEILIVFDRDNLQ